MLRAVGPCARVRRQAQARLLEAPTNTNCQRVRYWRQPCSVSLIGRRARKPSPTTSNVRARRREHSPRLRRWSRRNTTGTQLDCELEAQCSGDAPECGKTRGAASCFKTCNRRLCTANSGRQLRLREAYTFARLPYPCCQLEGLLCLAIANATFLAVGLRALDACPTMSFPHGLLVRHASRQCSVALPCLPVRSRPARAGAASETPSAE